MLGLAFSEAHRSQQIGLRLQKSSPQGLKSANAPASSNSSSTTCAGGTAGHKRSRRRRRQKKTSSGSTAETKSKSGTKKQHDAPMTKRDLYFALRCGSVGIGPGALDSAVGRVTLVNWENQVVLDTFVCVPVAVTDYRTAETGITPAALASQQTQPLDQVRQTVSALLKGKILIGHGLEVDLAALKLTHPWCDVRDAAKYSPYMKEVFDQLTVMLLPRDLEGLVSDVLLRDISEESTRGPIQEAVCCLDLYKKSRAAWEAELIKLVQQKEKQRGMIFSMRSAGKGEDLKGNSLSAIKEGVELDKVPPGFNAGQYTPYKHGNGQRYEVEDATTVASTEPRTIGGVESYRDDFSEGSTPSSSASSRSSFFCFGRGRSQIENLSDVEDPKSSLQGPQGDSIWTPARGKNSTASSSERASDEDERSRDDSSSIASSHGIWLPHAPVGTAAQPTLCIDDWAHNSTRHQNQQPQEPTSDGTNFVTEEELMDHLPSQLWNDVCDGESELLNFPRSKTESSHPVDGSDWLQEGGSAIKSAQIRQLSGSNWFRSRNSSSRPHGDSGTAEEQLSSRMSNVLHLSEQVSGGASIPAPQYPLELDPRLIVDGALPVYPLGSIGEVPDEDWMQEILQRRS